MAFWRFSLLFFFSIWIGRDTHSCVFILLLNNTRENTLIVTPFANAIPFSPLKLFLVLGNLDLQRSHTLERFRAVEGLSIFIIALKLWLTIAHGDEWALAPSVYVRIRLHPVRFIQRADTHKGEMRT